MWGDLTLGGFAPAVQFEPITPSNSPRRAAAMHAPASAMHTQLMKRKMIHLYRYLRADKNSALEQIMNRCFLRLVCYPQTLPRKGVKICSECEYRHDTLMHTPCMHTCHTCLHAPMALSPTPPTARQLTINFRVPCCGRYCVFWALASCAQAKRSGTTVIHLPITPSTASHSCIGSVQHGAVRAVRAGTRTTARTCPAR